MNNTQVVEVRKSRFGKCKLTFCGPTSGNDTNHYVYCDKDLHHYIRVWYYPPCKGWASEWHDSLKREYTSYGTAMLFGPHFRTAKEAWEFASQRHWS